MMKGFLFSGLLTVFLFCSCSFSNDVSVLNVSPERLFSSVQSNVVVFDYTDLQMQNQIDGIYDYFKDLKLWQELDLDFFYADLVDQIDLYAGSGVFEDVLIPVFRGGIKVAFCFDNKIFDYESGVYAVSVNTVEADSFSSVLDSYLKNKFGENLKKNISNGVEFWFVENESIYVFRKDFNFVYSNDLKKFEEILLNINKRDNFLSPLYGERETRPVLSLFSVNSSFLNFASFDFSIFLENDGIRGFLKVENFAGKSEKLSLIDSVSGDDAIFFIESNSLKSFLTDNLKIDHEKYLGLNKAQLLSLADNRFSFLMNFDENLPGLILFLKIKEKDKLLAESFVKHLDKFFIDFKTTFEHEFLNENENDFTDLIKIEALKNGLNKVYFDFKAPVFENNISLSNIFLNFDENTKFEVYYGLSSTGVLTASVHNDFLNTFSAEALKDSGDFSKAINHLEISLPESVSFFNFLKFWEFAENFSSVLYNLAYLNDEDMKYLPVLREIFLDKLVSFVSAGKKEGENYFIEMFLSFK